jgi:hypothetical protein
MKQGLRYGMSHRFYRNGESKFVSFEKDEERGEVLTPDNLITIYAHELILQDTQNFSEEFMSVYNGLVKKGRFGFNEPAEDYPDHINRIRKAPFEENDKWWAGEYND